MFNLDNLPKELLNKSIRDKSRFIEVANKALSDGRSQDEAKFQGILQIKTSSIKPEDKIKRTVPQHIQKLSIVQENTRIEQEELEKNIPVYVKEVQLDKDGYLWTEYTDGTKKKSKESLIKAHVMVAGGVVGSSNSSTGTIQEEDMYSELIDFYTQDDFYKGQAQPGSSSAASVWRIKRVITSVDGDVQVLWADGTADFTKSWDNRTSYTYS